MAVRLEACAQTASGYDCAGAKGEPSGGGGEVILSVLQAFGPPCS